jgi:hypothetical protein
MQRIRNLIRYHVLARSLKQELSAKEIIAIHQMGKVGSLSIWTSLRRSMIEQPIAHTHILHPADIKQQVSDKIKFLSCGHISKQDISSLLIRQLLDRGEGLDHSWKIITLMRDPIARNISMFFMASSQPSMVSEDYLSRAQAEHDVDGLIQKFVHQFGHKKYASWFDLHLNEPFGIDIFNSEFPKSKGYQILKFPHNIEVLVLKLEQYNDWHKQAFKEFLGIEDFPSKKANRATERSYSDIYAQFLQQAKFPAEFLRAVYDSKVMRHFYSEAEVAGFMQRWTAHEPTNLPTTIADCSFGQWWG